MQARIVFFEINKQTGSWVTAFQFKSRALRTRFADKKTPA